jgi:hypothetical protein
MRRQSRTQNSRTDHAPVLPVQNAHHRVPSPLHVIASCCSAIPPHLAAIARTLVGPRALLDFACSVSDLLAKRSVEARMDETKRNETMYSWCQTTGRHSVSQLACMVDEWLLVCRANYQQATRYQQKKSIRVQRIRVSPRARVCVCVRQITNEQPDIPYQQRNKQFVYNEDE